MQIIFYYLLYYWLSKSQILHARLSIFLVLRSMIGKYKIINHLILDPESIVTLITFTVLRKHVYYFSPWFITMLNTITVKAISTFHTLWLLLMFSDDCNRLCIKYLCLFSMHYYFFFTKQARNTMNNIEYNYWHYYV